MAINYKQIFVADFETTSHAQYLIDHYTRVWSWGLTNLHDIKVNYKHGTDLKSFMEVVSKPKKAGGIGEEFRERIIYFHNLKFDYEFLMWWLKENYFELSFEKPKNLQPEEYTLLKDSRGIIYSLSIKVDNTHLITFLDAYKLLPFSASQIAIDFKIKVDDEDIFKTKIDYNKYIPLNYTLEEYEYIYQRNDVFIIAQAIKELFMLTRFRKISIASMSLYDYRKNRFDRYIKFEDIFPSLLKEEWNFCKKSYFGGWTYVNPIYQNKLIKKEKYYNFCGFGIDKNSMYPDVMYNRLLPYGRGKYFKGEPIYDNEKEVFIAQIYIKACVKDKRLPSIRRNSIDGLKGNFYEDEICGFINLTNIDIDYIHKNYDVDDFEFIDGYIYKAVKGLFNNYIDYWSKIKEENTGAWRAIAKRFLNSLYGKFGMHYIHTNIYTCFNEDGIFEIKTPPKESEKLSYVPIASFITSYSRMNIIEDANKIGYDNFIYSDTDSIKAKLNFNTLEESEKYCIDRGILIHSKKLGYYKVENTFTYAKFIRAKSYMMFDTMSNSKYADGIKSNVSITLAGAPMNSRTEILRHMEKFGEESFDVSLTVGGKLRPKRVRGGLVLEPINFTIRGN